MSKRTGKTLARERRDETISSLPVAFTGRGGSKKGAGGSSAGTTPDTLFSTSTVRIVGLVGEGEIGGIVGGLKGVYRNDVPIQNADGTFNFKGITCDFRTGTPDQPYMPGYPDVETARNVGVKVNQATPVVASVSDENVNRVRVTVFIPALFIQKNDGTYQSNTVNYRIAARWYNGQYTTLGEFSVTGKTTSGYYRQHELDLPKNTSGASAPWAIQVTRLSPDTDGFNNSQSKYTVQSDLIFYSITDIIDSKLTYPWSALVGMTAQTSQLGDDLGEFRVLADGIKMMVPSNRDQSSRTYSGFWDGTFKEETSDSPPWVLYLLMENDRFGLGEFIDTAGLDKVTLYEIGRYCDTLVDDGAGGQEPRYTCNAEITSQEEAYDLLQLVAQIYHGMVYWSSGAVTSTFDAPRDARFLATESNVIDGLFTYSSSARKARHTAALVRWHDPKNLYRENIEFVELGEAIARYGYNPITIDLLGCTSRGQAHRHGLWTLLTETYETQVVKFQGGLDYALARPGDVVSVQDPQISNLDYGGRLLAGSTTSSLRLDREITLKPGVDFIIEVANPDGTVSERGISSVTTDTRGRAIVALANPLEFTPDSAVVWQISGDIVPQLFRIITITESQPHIYDVTGLQYEPTKYAAVDNGAPLVPEPISEFPNIVLPPTNLAVRESQYMSNGSARESLTLSWTAGQAFNSIGYYVTIVRPTGEVVNSPRTASTSIDILDAGPGDYLFIVVAVGLNGRTSLPAELTYTASGWAGVPAPSVTGLQVKGGGTQFRGRSCTMEWSRSFPNGQAPYSTQCVAYVYDISTNALLHREILPAGVTEFTYDYNVNVNEGGPRRAFRVAVTATTPDGREGGPASLAVSNPAPAKTSPTLTWTTESVVVGNTLPSDPDYAGFLIWISETQGFTPTDASVSVDTTSTNEFIRADPSTTYYVRVAAYDAFSKRLVDLNLSDEVSVTTNTFPIDTTGPDQPTGLTLTTASEVSASGVVTASITANWNPVGSSNLAQYQFELVEGDGTSPLASWMRNPTARDVSTYTWRGLKPGQIYAARVRGVNAAGFTGADSAVVTITSARNLNKPGPITNFTATSSYRAAALSWTNPPDLDLDCIEVWEGTATTQARLIQKIAAPAAFYFDNDLATLSTRIYWVRPVNTSGTLGDFVGPQSATIPQITAAALQNQIIDETKIAAGLEVPKNVTTLPTAGNYENRLAVYQGSLYRYTNGAWTKAVSAVDISGLITASQIQNLSATQIAGQLTSDQIASISAGKLTGQIVAAQLADNAVTQNKLASDLSAVGIVSGLPNPIGWTGPKLLFTDGKIWRLVDNTWTAGTGAADITGQLTAAQIASVNAAAVAGQLSDSQLSSIAAGKLVGQVVDNQIAALSTSKLSGQIQTFQIANESITAALFAAGTAPVGVSAGLPNNVGYTGPALLFNKNDGKLYRYVSGDWVASVASADISGTITAAQIAGVNASAVTGQLTAAQIGAVNAAVVAGTLSDSQLAGISTGKLIGQVVASQIASVNATALAGQVTAEQISSITAAQLTGTIVSTQITDGAISTPKIAAGAVTAASIAAGSILASKLAVASANLVFNADLGQGVLGWSTSPGSAQNYGAVVIDGATETTWAPPGMRSLAVRTTQVPTGTGVCEILNRQALTDGSIRNYLVAGNTPYEFSAYLSTHRCQAFVCLTWRDSGGAYISEAVGNYINDNHLSSAYSLSEWTRVARSTVIATAPANAVYADLRIRFGVSWEQGQLLPYCFVAGPMFAQAAIGQIEASPYVAPGLTTISGGSIATNSIAAAAITANSITTAQIAAGQVDADRLTANSITAGQIAAGTITATQIAAGTLTAREIAARTITALEIAAGTITAIQIKAGTITTAEIAAGTIQALNISAATITGDRIAANTIGAREIVANSITAGQIAAGTITATQIAAGTLTAREIAAGAVTASKLIVASSNLVFNADLAGQSTGWSAGPGSASNPGSLVVAPTPDVDYAPPGMKALSVRTTLVPTGGGVCEIYNYQVGASGATSMYRVSPSTPYEFSAYLSAHRCTAFVTILWFDINGNYISENLGLAVAATALQAYSPISVWNLLGRSGVVATSPSNAYSADLRVRFGAPWVQGQGVPYCFVSGMMLAQAAVGQTELSAYVDPTLTTIQGGAILTGSIGADRIVAKSLTAAQIQAKSLTAGEIAAGTLTATEIGVGTLTGDRLLAGTIGVRELAAKSITADQIAASTITGTEIKAGTITAREITAGTITGDLIQAGTITAALIAAETITGNKLVARTIYADRIQANSITAYEIMVRSLTADRLAANTITADELGANSVTAVAIAAGTITAREIAAGSISTYLLTVANRELSLTGFNFRWVNSSKQLQWDAGTVWYRDDDNTIKSAAVAAGAVGADSNSLVLLWYKGRTYLDYSADTNGGFYDKNWVTIGTYSGGGRFEVRYGATQIDGDRILTGSLHADRIQAQTITAAQIQTDTITAAQIAAGAIGVSELAAGAIVADKIGVGLNGTNLLYNSDFLIGSGVTGNWTSSSSFDPVARSLYVGINNAGDLWSPVGMRSLLVNWAGTAAVGEYANATLTFPKLDGGYTDLLGASPNRRYELSGYVSAHRSGGQIYAQAVDGSGNHIAYFGTNKQENIFSNGPLSTWARCTTLFTTPSNTAYLRIFVQALGNGGSNPYTFWSGLYLGTAQPNQTAVSDWAPGSVTIITGAGISARTITADQIRVGTITADLIKSESITGDRLVAGTIGAREVAANSITADRIQVGGGQSLTTLLGGPNKTLIDGGMISANSIRANTLQIGLRGLTVSGINIRYIVASRRIEWDAGTIAFTDDSGSLQSVPISADGFYVSGSNAYSILWPYGAGYLTANTDISYDKTHPNHVAIATYDNGTGLAVNFGATIIDGARIITGTVTADQIAANTIQTKHLGAGTITAEKIGTGQVTADKISGGRITASSVIEVGDSRMRLEANSGIPRIVIFDDNSNLRVLIGNTQGFNPNGGGNWGMTVWDKDGRVIFAPSGMNGDTIWARSIQAGSIAANTITASEITTGQLITSSAQIGTANIATLNLQGGAVSQLVSAYEVNKQSASVTLYVRANARVRISAQRTGNPSAEYPQNQGTGALYIRRDGGNIFSVPANFMYRYNNQQGVQASQKILLGHYASTIDTPGEGNHTYEVYDDNNAGVQGVYIEVTELAR